MNERCRFALTLKRLLALTLGLSAFPLFSQVADSTILEVSTRNEAALKIRNTTQAADTVLDNLHNYYAMGVLGNIGLPSYSLIADADAEKNIFRWMNLPHANDLFTSQQPVYFYPQGKVYTRLFAAMGQKQEQVFKLLHAQNIGRVNISLQFNRYSGFGFYNNQKSLTDNFLFSSHATTKNGRAGYNLYVVYNKLKYQLNGGIDTSRVDFDQHFLAQKQLFPVLLSSARQNLKTSEYNLELFCRINKDSAGAGHYLSLETNYESNYWMYADGIVDSVRYAHSYPLYLSAAGAHDSLSLKRFSNTLAYKLQTGKFAFYGGYKNEFAHYNQAYVDTSVMNHVAEGGLKIAPQNHLLTVHAQYVIAGPNSGNYIANCFYRGLFAKNFFGRLNANVNSQMVPFMSQQFYGSHIVWNNSFSPVITQNGKAEVGSSKYKFIIGAFFQLQSNVVYFDTQALPRQYAGTISITRLFAQKDLRVGHFHFNNTINYQVASNTDIVRLPTYYTFHQLYYEGKLFRKALWLQAGFQVRYISAFKANAYMPATDQFYLQNQKEYGNYPFADIFVNAQIARFRFFILASHANMGLSGANFMLAPNYPTPDRSIKAGLSWMFFD